MIPWVQVYSNLPHHPKIARLADELGLSSASVGMDTMAVGIVVSLWAWAIQNAYTGDLTGITDRVIAEACRWKKKPETLVKALMAAGWIDADRHIHDWEEYSVLLLNAEDERRQKTAERVRRYRNKRKTEKQGSSNDDVTVTGNADDTRSNAPTIPYQTIPYVTSPTTRACAQEETLQPFCQDRQDGAQDPELARVMSFYLNKINPTPSMESTEELKSFLRDMQADVIIAAMQYALDERKATWSYIRGTLRGYHRRGIRTIDDLRRANEAYERTKKNREGTTYAGNRGNHQKRAGSSVPPPGADLTRGFHTDAD